jgi:HEAT repeat protein
MTRLGALLCVAGTVMVLAVQGASKASAQEDRRRPTCIQLASDMQPGQPDPKRYEAIRALAARGSAAACAIDPLRKATRDDTFTIRAAAVQALGKIGPRAIGALPDLVARWHDAEVDGGDIVAALHGLGPAAIPRLVPYLKATRAFDEVADGAHPIASRALATFGSQAVPALTRALRRPATRVAAVAALRQIGSGAAPAVPSLVAAYDARDSDEWDRGAILGALGAIGEGACAARPLLERQVVTERERLGSQSYEVQQIEAILSKLRGCP